MQHLGSKVLLIPIKEETQWEGFEDKEAVKCGEVAFDFKHEDIELKKGDIVYYQYGSNLKIKEVEYVLVSESGLIAKK